ncbi:phage baseplate assembly protein V [Streptomyces sp. NPDC002588]|uniref:phage baseplate assembly protein V n=1 Tax=Streptomyces sp. NPDC002588 TaxID=3154419 RepID=UPI00332C498C
MTMDSSEPARARYFGVYPAVVGDNQDPDQQGRIEVRLPWSPDTGSGEYAVWARLATTMAGGGRGTWLVPETGDEVLVSFGGGDPNWPYVVGALWNGQDQPPESMDPGNNIKSIVSRTGIRISLDDTDGAVTLSLETPGGQKVTLEDGGSTIRLADSGGNSLELAPAGVTLTAASKLSISAASIQIDAGSANVSAAMWAHSGVIKCDTAIASAVVGSSYTPGAGNAT